jgi:DNA-binding XRE family transcriptional regulator
MKTEEQNIYIEREKQLSDLEYEFIKSFILTRKKCHLTQQQLATQANVIRETIVRIENLMTSPQLNTLIKILEPLGYTVEIVPIKKKS